MPSSHEWLRRAVPTVLCALVAAPVVVPRDRLRLGGGGGGYEEAGACEDTQFRKYATATAIYERDFWQTHTLRLQLQWFRETGDDLPRAAWGLLGAADWRKRWRYVGLGAGIGLGGLSRKEDPPPPSSESGTAGGNAFGPFPRFDLELGPRWLHWYGAVNPGPTLYLGDGPLQLATGVGTRYGRLGAFVAFAGGGGEIVAILPLTSGYTLWAQVWSGESGDGEPLYGGLGGFEIPLGRAP